MIHFVENILNLTIPYTVSVCHIDCPVQFAFWTFSISSCLAVVL